MQIISTLEDRLKMNIGELVMQVISLQADIDAKDKIIVDLQDKLKNGESAE